MDLMLRRRGLDNGLTQDGYINDGLVFQLDGIKKGSDNSIWKSLVGDIAFDLTDCVYTDNGVQFNGSTSKGIYNGIIPYTPGNATIEFCAEFLKNNSYSNWFILCPAKQTTENRLGAALARDNSRAITIGFGTANNTRWYARTYTMTASANDMRGYVNGAAIDKWANVGAFSANSGNYTSIGCRGNSTLQHVFMGTMHAIRIYNRILSADEMIHNQRVDNKRFQLNLF